MKEVISITRVIVPEMFLRKHYKIVFYVPSRYLSLRLVGATFSHMKASYSHLGNNYSYVAISHFVIESASECHESVVRNIVNA